MNQSLINIKEQTQQQSVLLVKNIIRRDMKGFEMNGYEAAQKLMEIYGIYTSHHLCTEIMDGMTRNGEAKCTQGWGTTRYLIS